MKVPDGPTLFDAIADTPVAADTPHVARVTTDNRRGHILLTANPNDPQAPWIGLADLGDNGLHLWSGQGMLISPQAARELADALHWWADRKQPAACTEEQPE